ncbi:MAG: MOSC domain-containing protein [Mycobacteriales bacterium]
MSAELVAVNAGHAVPVDWADGESATAIDKRPLPGRVAVHRLGVTGDEQVFSGHGGPDQAVYAYAREDAAWWERELDRPLRPGMFGENLTTAGLDVTGALIGERWRIGSVLVEVTSPRIPCRTFAGFWDVRDLIKRFTARGWPGAYLRVVEEGELAAGDPVKVVHRPDHGVTIGVAFRARTTEPGLLPRLLDAPELPEPWQRQVRKRLGQAEPAP